jgi:hypothetical protein
MNLVSKIKLFSLSFCITAFSYAQTESLPSGDMVTLLGGDFEMAIPEGYKMLAREAGAPMVLKAPRVDGYERNVIILEHNSPSFIDDGDLSFWNEKIEKQSKRLINVVDFRVRNGQVVDLDNGQPAIVVYTSFRDSGIEYMQMHLVLSNQNHSLQFVYTDLLSHFEDESQMFFPEIWGAISSSSLKGSPQWRYQSMSIAIAVFLVIVGSFGAATIRRRMIAAKRIQSLENEVEGRTDSGHGEELTASDSSDASLDMAYQSAHLEDEQDEGYDNEANISEEYNSHHDNSDDFADAIENDEKAV